MAKENGTATADEATQAQAPERKERNYIVVPMTAELRSIFENEANGKALGPYVRDVLAQMKGVVIPPTERSARVKYATPEEKKAAQKAQAKSRQELIKELMARHRAEQAAQKAQADGTAAAVETPQGEAVPA